jgi:CRP-like cAMP-binding protein
MKQGDIFGEIGLIYNTNTTASVVSLKYSRAALLEKEDV